MDDFFFIITSPYYLFTWSEETLSFTMAGIF